MLKTWPFGRRGHRVGENCLDFDVVLVKAVTVLYFAYARGAYYFFFGFLSATP